MGAVVAVPGAAAGVLRALLACPASVLLSEGEEALKAVLPKVFLPVLLLLLCLFV